MCLACEDQSYFFHVFVSSYLERGEIPPGLTPEDLKAMGYSLPEAGTPTQPALPARASVAAGNGFTCDSPADE